MFVTTNGALLTHCYRVYHFNFLCLLPQMGHYWPTVTGLIISIFLFLLPQLGIRDSSVTGFVILNFSFLFSQVGDCKTSITGIWFLTLLTSGEFWSKALSLVPHCYCYETWGIARFTTNNSLFLCDIWRSHSGANEDSSLPVYDAVQLSSYICHGFGPLVNLLRSHVSRSLFKGLPWFLLPVGQ